MIAPKQIGVSVSIAQKIFSRRHTELNKFETGSGSPGSVPIRYRVSRSSVGVAPQARTALSDPFWTRCTCNQSIVKFYVSSAKEGQWGVTIVKCLTVNVSC